MYDIVSVHVHGGQTTESGKLGKNKNKNFQFSFERKGTLGTYEAMTL